jgi:hypothetical protein
MAASRDAGDDVIVDPTFEGVDREFGPCRVDADGVADLFDVLEIDARRVTGIGQAGGNGGEPVPEPATDTGSEGPRSDEDGGDVGVSVLADFEFEVIDLADEPVIGICDLAVQEMKMQVEFATLRSHWPAFV